MQFFDRLCSETWLHTRAFGHSRRNQLADLIVLHVQTSTHHRLAVLAGSTIDAGAAAAPARKRIETAAIPLWLEWRSSYDPSCSPF